MALTTDEARRLAELTRAYDELISGRATAMVEYAGERTMFNRVDPDGMARLKDAITELQTRAREPGGFRRRGRALRFRL